MINSFLAYKTLILFVKPCFGYIFLSVKFENQLMSIRETNNESCYIAVCFVYFLRMNSVWINPEKFTVAKLALF